MAKIIGRLHQLLGAFLEEMRLFSFNGQMDEDFPWFFIQFVESVKGYTQTIIG